MASAFLLKWLLGKVMAVHLKKILGDLLYLEEPDQTKDHLPSPEDLRNKVMRLAVFASMIFIYVMSYADQILPITE